MALGDESVKTTVLKWLRSFASDDCAHRVLRVALG
jgi:hypothetical protein